MVVERATIDDIDEMYALTRRYASEGLLLPRSQQSLLDRLCSTFVARSHPGGPVLGMVGLEVLSRETGEVRSLAVSEAAQGQGVGRRLVEAAVAEARRLNLRRVISLTLTPGFFSQCGFIPVDRLSLPEKLVRDCFRCPKRLECREVAMVRWLAAEAFDAPAVAEAVG